MKVEVWRGPLSSKVVEHDEFLPGPAFLQLFSHISEVMFDESYLMNFDHFERCLCYPIAKFVQNKCLILVKDSNQVLKNKF